MRSSYRWLLWGLVAALLLAGGAWWVTGIRLQAYQDHSPILSTRTKGLLRAHSLDGLTFTVDPNPVARSYASSQVQYRDAGGRYQVIGTDPTKLIGRDASGRVGPPKASTLFKMDIQTGQRELLVVAPCFNAPQSDVPPVQCVDPAIYRQADGGMLLSFVRISGRGDPAVTGAKNEFITLSSSPQGGWSDRFDVVFRAAHAADPDLVRLPDGRWRMYYTSGAALSANQRGSAPAILSAISSDGKTFEPEAGIRVFGCSASATLTLVSGGYRLYCHTRDVFQPDQGSTDQRSYVVSYTSGDGLIFRREPGVRVGVAPVEGARFIGSEAPSLTLEEDGSVTMLITTVVEGRYPWNQQLLDEEMEHIVQIGGKSKHRGPRSKRLRKPKKGPKPPL